MDESVVDHVIAADNHRRSLLAKVEGLKAEKNALSKQVAELRRRGEDAGEQIAEADRLAERIKELDEAVAAADEQLRDAMLRVPNVPHSSVPRGAGASANQELRRWGEPPTFGFTPKPHWEIGEQLGILDFARAVRMSGTRFVLYKGQGALLERALINFMLDLHTREHCYLETFPPFLVNAACLVGTGSLPKFEEDLFRTREGYYLIPTAEVPVTNIHREEILSESDLPIHYVAYSACFRSEAGAAGRDTRGLVRHHQFNKVELVKFCKPETSYDELESLTRNAEEVLRRLGLHYRVLVLCTGDMTFASAKTIDLEAWAPGMERYLEVSTCSNFEAFQARRAQIRFRRESTGKVEFVHTLNGSGVAMPRTMAALLETYQQPDGSVVIPEVLRPYMHGLERIEPGAQSAGAPGN